MKNCYKSKIDEPLRLVFFKWENRSQKKKYKYMKRHSTSLILRELHIKATMKYPFHPKAWLK